MKSEIPRSAHARTLTSLENQGNTELGQPVMKPLGQNETKNNQNLIFHLHTLHEMELTNIPCLCYFLLISNSEVLSYTARTELKTYSMDFIFEILILLNLEDFFFAVRT